MFNRFVLVVVIVPLAILLVALAVANRAPVSVTLDPINAGNPALTLTLPLFFFLFLALAIGVLLGGFATWWRQGRYRKLARQKAQEAETLRAATLRQVRDGQPALPKPGL
ncbi:MAG: lipopolysaccharide assembly protein LapA domain-containing protein [Rhizobiaceae bacterium]